MVFTAAHTGARRSELLASKLCDFDATHMTIREKKRIKGKRSTRRVPVSAKLRKVLDDWRAIHPGGNFTFCMDATPRSDASQQGGEPTNGNSKQKNNRRVNMSFLRERLFGVESGKEAIVFGQSLSRPVCWQVIVSSPDVACCLPTEPIRPHNTDVQRGR
jgi:hypothetical protein